MSTDIEDFIRKKIEDGQFRTRDEVVEAAVSMYRDLEEFDSLRSEIERRLEVARHGHVAPLDITSIKEELLSEFDVDGRHDQ